MMHIKNRLPLSVVRIAALVALAGTVSAMAQSPAQKTARSDDEQQREAPAAEGQLYAKEAAPDSFANMSVGFFEGAAKDLRAVAKLTDQAFDPDGKVAVIRLNASQTRDLPKLDSGSIIWKQDSKSDRSPSNAEWVYRLPAKPGENRWNVEPKVATVQLNRQHGHEGRYHVLVELTGVPIKSFSGTIDLSEQTNVAFVTAKKDEDSCYVVGVELDDIPGWAQAHATEALDRPVAVASPPLKQPDACRYRIQGVFFEFSDEAMSELRKSLSVDTTSPAAWIISEADAASFHDFAKVKLDAGSATLLSRPQMMGLSGVPMEVQIGSQVPVDIPSSGDSDAVEFKTIGVELGATLSPVSLNTDRLDWKLGNTDRDGDWSFVNRNISGVSLLQVGASALIALPTKSNNKMHMVVMLTPEKLNAGLSNPIAGESDLQKQQFAQLVEQYNQLMKSRRYAEAALIGNKAREIRPNDPAAIIMHERARLQIQVASIQKAKKAAGAMDAPGNHPAIAKSPLDADVVTDPEVVVQELPSLGASPVVKASRFRNETFQIEASRIVKCAVGHKVKLKHSSRIKAVSEFDSSVLKVEPVQGVPNCVSVYAVTEGGTQIRIVDEHDAEYVVNVLSLEFDGLGIFLKHLFPRLDIEVWPIKGAVLLRGAVASEVQKQHVIQVAQQFYPVILNQLVAGATSAAPQSKSNRHESIDDGIAAQPVVEVTAINSSLLIPRSCTKTLTFPVRIRSVIDFNSELIKVDATRDSANRISIHALENGATQLTVIDENDQQFLVDIVVEDSVQELSLLAERLYPNLNLKFFPVHGAVVVRGAVDSESQCEQILDLVRQFSPTVLNQSLIVTNAATTKDKTQAMHESVMNTDGIQAIRSDIKALHGDVRQLLQILEARKTQKNQTDSEADLSESNFRRVSNSDSGTTSDSPPFQRTTGEAIKFFPSTDSNSSRTAAAFTRSTSSSDKRRLALVCDQPGRYREYLELVSKVCRQKSCSEPILYVAGPYFSETYDVQSTLCLVILGSSKQGAKLEGKASELELREFLTNPPKLFAPASRSFVSPRGLERSNPFSSEIQRSQ